MDKEELKDKISELANSIKDLSIKDLEESNNAKTALGKAKELNELLIIFNYISENSNVNSNENPPPISEGYQDANQTDISSEETGKSLNSSLVNTDNYSNTLNKKQISNLTSSIGINERFLLIKDLFEGSTEKFNESINLLNNCNNKEEANKILSTKMQNEYGWNEESEAYTILSELVNNRFNH